jgi:hypothetical protein
MCYPLKWKQIGTSENLARAIMDEGGGIRVPKPGRVLASEATIVSVFSARLDDRPISHASSTR